MLIVVWLQELKSLLLRLLVLQTKRLSNRLALNHGQLTISMIEQFNEAFGPNAELPIKETHVRELHLASAVHYSKLKKQKMRLWIGAKDLRYGREKICTYIVAEFGEISAMTLFVRQL
jgi:hypothetical protein